MASLLPEALNELIESFRALPGVGERTAERYALYLLNNESAKARKLADSLALLHENVRYCEKTFALTEPEKPVSELYTNPKRNKQVVAVVENPLDVIALERTGEYKGTYHVLGGLISPIDGIGPEQLSIKELLTRIDDDDVQEVILATNASVEGESTALYIQKQIHSDGVQVTRLARGLPAGVDLEYADQITISRALEGRQTF